jgi:hypothetical protein
MLNYLGTELISEIQKAYNERLQLAVERGYSDPGSKYYWLFEELSYRVKLLRQVNLFLNSLSLYMTSKDGDQPMYFVVSYTTDLFTEKRIGEAAFNREGKEQFFLESCTYWLEMQEVLDIMGHGYNYTNLPLYYVDLCEYAVRAVRLHLYIREREFHAIDRDKFDALMRRQIFQSTVEGGVA